MEKQHRFPGTKSFTSDESFIFFGRDEDIANICTSIVVNPTTVLFGKSGSGKSSLIQAGIIPALQERTGGQEDQSGVYLPVTVLPKPYNKGDNLYHKIHEIINTALDCKNNFLQLTEDQELLLLQQHSSLQPSSLWYLLKQFQYQQLMEKKRQVLLLIFDQAEELFTYPDSQVSYFVKELYPVISQFTPDVFQKIVAENKSLLTAEANMVVHSPLPVKFIFSLRSDKLHLITRLKMASPHILQNSYELLPLKKKEAFEAMDGPSKHEGENFISKKFEISNDAKEYIFEELAIQANDPEMNSDEKRVEPFGLQIICSHIEQKIVPDDKDRVIEKRELHEPNNIINDYYLECINSLQVKGNRLSEKEKTDVRILIEEKMLSNNRRIPIHQETIKQYKDCEVSEDILKMLVKVRILKKDYDAYSVPIYEITHDCLIEPILQAMKVRIGDNTDDKSQATINELLKQIEKKEQESFSGKSSSKRKAGFEKNKEERNVGKASLGAGIEEDLELFELYKKLGDAYIVIKNYEKAIESFNMAMECPPEHSSKSFFTEIYKARADAYYYTKNYKESSKDLKKVLEQNPDDYTAAVYLIHNYDLENKLDEALKYFSEEIKISPQNAGLFTEIGNKYFAKKEYITAKQLYKLTLEKNPEAAYAVRNLGLVEEASKNYPEALKYYQQYVESNKDSPDIYNDIGNVYYTMNDYENAKKNYLLTIEKDNKYHYAYHNLGLIEEKKENFENAIEYYEKAIESNPNYEDAYFKLSDLCYRTKKYDRAKELYSHLIEKNPDNENNYYDLGLIEEAMEDYDDAIDHYKKAVQINAYFKDALIRLSSLLYDKKDYANAKEYYRTLLAINSQNEEYNYGLGLIEENLKNTEAALALYNKAVEIKKDFIEVHYRIGKIKQEQGKTEEAIQSLKKIIEFDKNNLAALNDLGVCHFTIQNWKQAEEYFMKCMEAEPGNYLYHYNMGTVEAKLGSLKESEKFYKKAIELNPDYPNSFYNYGDLLELMKRPKEAIVQYKKYLELIPDDQEVQNRIDSIEKKPLKNIS